jgi:hypothetical protein
MVRMATDWQARRWLFAGLALGALVLLVAGGVWAATGGPYDVSWFTVDGGGAFSAGTGYRLGGTAGQADAGVLAGGGYTLAGGFWAGGVAAPPPPLEHGLYLPLVVRGG